MVVDKNWVAGYPGRTGGPWNPATGSYRQQRMRTLVHEFGHVVHTAEQRGVQFFSWAKVNRETLGWAHWPDHSWPKLWRQVSNYATTNASEFTAEAFTAAVLYGDSAPVVAKLWIKHLDDALTGRAARRQPKRLQSPYERWKGTQTPQASRAAPRARPGSEGFRGQIKSADGVFTPDDVIGKIDTEEEFARILQERWNIDYKPGKSQLTATARADIVYMLEYYEQYYPASFRKQMIRRVEISKQDDNILGAYAPAEHDRTLIVGRQFTQDHAFKTIDYDAYGRQVRKGVYDNDFHCGGHGKKYGTDTGPTTVRQQRRATLNHELGHVFHEIATPGAHQLEKHWNNWAAGDEVLGGPRRRAGSHRQRGCPVA